MRTTEDTMEFRITKKLLSRKYPFVKDIHIDHKSGLYKTLTPIVATIDPFEFAEKYGVNIHPSELQAMGYTEDYFSPDLVWLVSRQDSKKVRGIQEQMYKDISDIHKSPIIPNDERLDKELHITQFVIDERVKPQG